MNKSESIKELSSAMANFAVALNGAVKDTANPFFKSKYADLSSVTDAIKAALGKTGLSYVQVSHDGDKGVAIETVILHSSGEWLSTGSVSVPVSKADAQGYGSALTYARRYSLAMAFGVAPEDDDGNAAAKAPPKSAKSVPQDAWDNCDVDTKTWLTDIAANVKVLFGKNDVAGAFDEIESHKLEIENKTALWYLFDSKQRSALTTEANERKKAA